MRLSLKVLWLFVIWGCVVFFTLAFVLWFFRKSMPPYVFPLCFVLWGVLVLVYFTVVLIKYKTYKLNCCGRKLQVSHGFFIKAIQKADISDVLSVKALTTPLMRLMGLSSVVLVFEGSVLILPPLDVNFTKSLFKDISAQGDELDAV